MMSIQHTLHEGFRLHQSGQFVAARTKYQLVLDQQPEHFDALHLSGVIAGQVGELHLALELLLKANTLNPNDQAVKMNLAKVASDLGNYTLAIQCLLPLWQANPKDIALCHTLALNYLQAQDFLNAIKYFDCTLKEKPHWEEAYCNRANAWLNIGRYSEALADVDTAIELKYNYATAYFYRGKILHKQGQLDAAQTSFEEAVKLNPTLIQAHINLSRLHFQREKFHDMIASSNAALDIDKSHAPAYNNRGLAYMELGDYDAAKKDFQKSIEIKPNYVFALTNLGKLLRYTNQQSAAITCYRQALAIEPDYAVALFGLGLCELQIGDYFNGWTHYESRWQQDILNDQSLVRNLSKPVWNGTQALQGKTILLHSEQGFGDTIQFCRYARLVKAQGARVILEVPNSLFALLQNLEGVDELIKRGSVLPTFDYHCPLMSIPYALRFNCAGIFVLAPYLSVIKQKQDQWQKILTEKFFIRPNLNCEGTSQIVKKKAKRIGLVWSGNPKYRNDLSRSLTLEELAKYLPKHADYVCLQKDIHPKDAGYLQARPDIQIFSSQLYDFSDTAALCSVLDLVVSVDTSVAHLAGAIGIPVIILLPSNSDWRWLLHHDQTSWYQSATLIRQTTAGHWDTAFQLLNRKLLEIIE